MANPHPIPDFSPEELASEEWRPVAGYEGFYDVSNLGRIRSYKRWTWRGGIINPVVSKRGYWCVNLSRPGAKRRYLTVHRLVAAAFIAPSDMDVNHIDGVKTNSRVSNLEYVTHRQNMCHASRAGLLPFGDRNASRKHPEKQQGERNPGAKLATADVIAIRELRAQGVPAKVLAVRFRVHVSCIFGIVSRLTWRHLA